MKALKLLKIVLVIFTLNHALTAMAGVAACGEEKVPFSVFLSEDHSVAQIFYENKRIKYGYLICQKNLSDLGPNYYLLCSSKDSTDIGYTTHFIIFDGIISAHISEISVKGLKLIQSLPCI